MSRVNKRRGDEEVNHSLQEILKHGLQFLVFLSVILLPYITMTSFMGMNTFLDSFEHAESYDYLKDPNTLTFPVQTENSYVFIQRSSHPQFTISPGEYVVYYSQQGIECEQVTNVKQQPLLTIYTTHTHSENTDPLYKYDLVGKIVGTCDDTLWNALSITLWETSVSNLNIRALFTNE